MEHLGWFFAGTSLGLFVGVLVTSLARLAEMAEEPDFENMDERPAKGKLFVLQQ